jgi:hypothetical protein
MAVDTKIDVDKIMMIAAVIAILVWMSTRPEEPQ